MNNINFPLISIITVCLNSEETILDTIDSVLEQKYPNIEYIIIDGGSSDSTVDLIRSYEKKIDKFVCEPDDGLYDAMNKGIEISTGDIVGVLNSDDFYIDNNVLSEVVTKFSETNIDSIFANLVYVKSKNINKVIRFFDSGQFKPSLFSYGLMPAHPTFFVKRDIYERLGKYRTDLKNAADFDLMVRFLYQHNISYYYFDKVIVIMRLGGKSTSLKSIWTNNIEILNVCKSNGIRTNILKILLRYAFKIYTLFKR
jgi:glycosyltransferase involved in cell wall biosynthesis